MPIVSARVTCAMRAVWLLLLLAAPCTAQEQPRVAGSEGVPVPKRTKMVKPEYPPEAQAQGLRGIVILDLTIDAFGKVAEVDLIRSIPGLDEAAIAAVRKWEYEPVKLGGRPVPVKLTVPITFLMQLPEITRQAGIPELRQGAVPAFPKGAETVASASAIAEVSVDTDGRVVEAEIRSGDPPFAEALLQAVRTWAFVPDQGRGTISFRVQADFTGGDGRRRVALHLSGLGQAESMVAAAPPPAAEAAGQEKAEPATAASVPSPAPAASAAAPKPPLPPAQPPAPTSQASTPPATPPSQTPGPPAIEVLRSPVEAPKPEPGVSAVRDVTLGPGMPELLRGRRPVPPPLARMAGVTGTVQVRFAIDAGGGASVQGSDGPDLLRPAAEQAVASWVFRRTTTERVRALAEIGYRDDGASASVRLER
jgi:TonB family protein